MKFINPHAVSDVFIHNVVVLYVPCGSSFRNYFRWYSNWAFCKFRIVEK